MEQNGSGETAHSSRGGKGQKRRFHQRHQKSKKTANEGHAEDPSNEHAKHTNREDRHVDRLEARMSGFVVTCARGNERRCVMDSYGLLNTFYEVYFPEAKNSSGNENGTKPTSDETVGDGDASAYVSEESALAELSTSFAERRSRFQSVNTNVKQCIFIMSSIEDPVSFLHNSLSTLLNASPGTSAVRTRFVERMLPCVGSCSAKIDALRLLCEQKLPAYFPKVDEQNPASPSPKSFEIIYKARNTGDAFTRDEVIICIGDVMKRLAPHVRVDLRNPDITISLDVFCKVCCLCVCPEYSKLKRYNIHGLVQQDEGEKPVKGSEEVPNGDEKKSEIAQSE